MTMCSNQYLYYNIDVPKQRSQVIFFDSYRNKDTSETCFVLCFLSIAFLASGVASLK